MPITNVIPSSAGFVLNGNLSDATALNNATAYASGGDAGGPGVPGCLTGPFDFDRRPVTIRHTWWDERSGHVVTQDPATMPNNPAVVRGDIVEKTIVTPSAEFVADWLASLSSGARRNTSGFRNY